MNRSRFTEEQNITVLREAESGTPVKDLCPRAGVSTVTFYKWKAKYTKASTKSSDMKGASVFSHYF